MEKNVKKKKNFGFISSGWSVIQCVCHKPVRFIINDGK